MLPARVPGADGCLECADSEQVQVGNAEWHRYVAIETYRHLGTGSEALEDTD